MVLDHQVAGLGSVRLRLAVIGTGVLCPSVAPPGIWAQTNLLGSLLPAVSLCSGPDGGCSVFHLGVSQQTLHRDAHSPGKALWRDLPFLSEWYCGQRVSVFLTPRVYQAICICSCISHQDNELSNCYFVAHATNESSRQCQGGWAGLAPHDWGLVEWRWRLRSVIPCGLSVIWQEAPKRHPGSGLGGSGLCFLTGALRRCTWVPWPSCVSHWCLVLDILGEGRGGWRDRSSRSEQTEGEFVDVGGDRTRRTRTQRKGTSGCTGLRRWPYASH